MNHMGYMINMDKLCTYYIINDSCYCLVNTFIYILLDKIIIF